MQQDPIPAPTGNKEETVTQLVHRHLMDPTHETTDEELRNVKLHVAEDEVKEKAIEKHAELTGTDEPAKDHNSSHTIPQDVLK